MTHLNRHSKVEIFVRNVLKITTIPGKQQNKIFTQKII